MISGLLYNKPILWKVDTGSRKTFLTFDTYDNISTKHKFSNASGQEILCRSKFLMTLKLEGKELYFPVIVGDVTNNLLGENLITQLECNSHYDAQEIIIKLCGQNIIQRKQKHVLKKYVTAATVYAPAGNECICHIKLKNRSCESEKRDSELGILTPE